MFCLGAIVALNLAMCGLFASHASSEETVSSERQLEQLMALEGAIHAGNLEKIDAYVNTAADQGFGYAQYMRALRLMLENRAPTRKRSTICQARLIARLKLQPTSPHLFCRTPVIPPAMLIV